MGLFGCGELGNGLLGAGLLESVDGGVDAVGKEDGFGLVFLKEEGG